MIDPSEGLYATVTLNDVQLAEAYFPILVELARQRRLISYGDLVAKAKRIYPSRIEVQNAIAVSTGRKLDVVRLFTYQRELPDLTCLVVNGATQECGAGFTDHFDPVEARKQVYAYAWKELAADFSGFISVSTRAIKPRKSISKKVATKLMSEYYAANKHHFSPTIRAKRDDIIRRIMDGDTPEEAFEAYRSAT